MGRLQVSTGAVRAGAAAVSGVGGQLTSGGASVRATTGAADDTTAAGAYDAAAEKLAARLGQYGGLTDSLANALACAASCYEASDVLPSLEA